MKCPKCSGAGYIYNNLVGYAEDCSVCHGKGEIQQTNEECLRSCRTTEELAEFICANAVQIDCIANGINPYAKEDMIEWLKQPHTKE